MLSSNSRFLIMISTERQFFWFENKKRDAYIVKTKENVNVNRVWFVPLSGPFTFFPTLVPNQTVNKQTIFKLLTCFVFAALK